MADPRQVEDATYTYDGEDFPRPTTATITRVNSDNPFIDDLKPVLIGNLMDAINAAWNGWEAACKCEDEGLQTYYMKFVVTCHATLEKVKKISN